MDQQEIYDLLIVTDATASMSRYLWSLHTSLPEIISISALTGCFSHIGLLGYRDYCDNTLLEWSGWLRQSSSVEEEQPDLVAKAESIAPEGGGDYPEATKTALAKAYEVMRPEATTLLLFYTDAPPHAAGNGSVTVSGSNYQREHEALSDPKSYGGFGPSFIDWVSACKTLRSGEKKVQVFCMLEPSMAWEYAGHYSYLCTLTRGSCIFLKDSSPTTISKVTVEVLLSWMGVEKAGTSDATNYTELPATLCRYVDIENIRKIKDEDDPIANRFFATTSSRASNSMQLISANIARVDITPEVLKKHLPKKRTPLSDFARTYTTDAAYRVIVVEHLKKIIDSDVRVIALNPVFGSLWRAVCNDRTHDSRDGLISAFGLQVERISDPDDKAHMKAWVEESYDYTGEVREMLNGVHGSERFPCVCLDPTLSFVQSRDDMDYADEDERPITAFRRDELLEIGRSCDFRILRRLGRILTRLTYITSASDIPEHIAGTTDDEVPKIPIALASEEHGRQFWRILLHIIVPGTMLSARPAALLAALSLRLGVEPLTQAAEREMFRWRNRWNDLDVPEIWSVSCLSLLLDADQIYRQSQQDLGTSNADGHMQPKPVTLLKEDDRNLFEHLVTYKMLELNLDTTLTVQLGWTPEKTIVPIGPSAFCRSCQCLRSVTIMGRSGKCGLCLCTSFESSEVREKRIKARVSKEDGELTPAPWVECSVRTCRAQYVVYNVEALNVRPKCHYCRSESVLPASERSNDPAPCVECSLCLNRIIWPKTYRPSSFSIYAFICPPCTSGRKTIVDHETTAKKISAENSTSWLVQDSEKPAAGPFTNRSLYHTISTIGSDPFLRRIKLFPPTKHPLTVRGKLIRNPSSIISTLQDSISRRQTERAPCSLCFSTFHPTGLSAACGRRGCHQRICRNCLSGWYGLNAAGRIINTAALSCPFCRRKPAARTLAKHGMGIHAVGNLAEAVRDQGHWIHAWCRICGFARRYIERVCAHGMPAELHGWTCDDCREEAERLRGPKRSKPCPGCRTLTEKIGGCDHISCPVKNCGTHWCYFCGEACPERTIYDHIRERHGGYYDGFHGELLNEEDYR